MSPLWGGANGFVVDITLKGSRLVTNYPSPERGATGGSWIVNFDEQQTYRLFPDTREYSVKKFHDVMNGIAETHHDIEAAVPAQERLLPTTSVDLPAQSRRRASRFEYRADVKETGQRKQILGYDTREVILTITACEGGKTLDENGGWVVTNTVWLAPRIPAIDNLVATQRRYVKTVTKGIYDTVFTDIEFPGNEFYDPFYPEHAIVGVHVIAETEKLDGTVLSSSTVYELARTAKEMKSAQSQYEAQQKRLTGSGARVLGGAPPQRTRMVTMTMTYLSLESNVSDSDVAVPASYVKVKK
jgi:hypothetical protein